MSVPANCRACGGACCEEFALPLGDALDDASRWFALHGTRVSSPSGPALRFACRCTKLTPRGSCSIYETRPEVCRTYEAGGPECLEVLSRRRSPEQRARILGTQLLPFPERTRES